MHIRHTQIKKQNCWSFQVETNANQTNGDINVINKFITSEGVLIMDNNTEQANATFIEELMSDFSLCGNNGSIKNKCLTIKKDGKYRHNSLKVKKIKTDNTGIVHTEKELPVSSSRIKFSNSINIIPPRNNGNNTKTSKISKPSMFSLSGLKSKFTFGKNKQSMNIKSNTSVLGGFVKKYTSKQLKKINKYKK